MTPKQDELWNVAAMMEFQAKVALDSGKRNLEIDATSIVPKIVAVMRASLPAAPAVPEGMVLVPREPNVNQQIAMSRAAGGTFAAGFIAGIYRAAIAAAEAAHKTGERKP